MSDDNKTALSIVFEGNGVSFFTFRGRLCVIGTEYGKAIGYGEDGSALTHQLTNEWSDEFIVGHHFDVLKGADLREFKRISALTGQNHVSGNARNLTILYEPGFDLVALLTKMPLGKKLRAVIVAEVLPKLRRGETILPAVTPVASLSEWSPEAIALKKAALLLQIANDMSPAVSIEAKDAMRANAAVFLTGGPITPMLPALPPGRWRRPTEIATELGRTVAAIGRAITALGFRDASQANHCKVVLDKKKYGDGQVECFLWDDHVVDSLKSHFVSVAA